MPIDLSGKIRQTNGRLKAGNIRARVLQQGGSLYIQATLPPKPGSGRERPFQQKIALGMSATGQGLKLAEAEAKKVGGALDRGDFSWSNYVTKDAPPETIGAWIERYEDDYFNRRPRNPKTETTWRSEYQRVFKKLPSSQPLSVESVFPAIAATQPDTRTRKRFVQTCSRLLKFAGIDPSPLADLKGNYNYASAAKRNIPSDVEISRVRERLIAEGNNERWVWAYSAMVVWGVRNHELFYLDLSRFPIALVKESKTTIRSVWPFYPEWAEQWELDKHLVPNCTGRTHEDLGQRVSRAFQRMNVGFPPYALRHAWSIRTIEFGLPDTLAAQQQGHSVQVHNAIYHKWITDKVHERAFRAICQNPERPRPPDV